LTSPRSAEGLQGRIGRGGGIGQGCVRHLRAGVGEIVEGNAALADAPGDVIAEPMGKGWFFKIRLSTSRSSDSLMDEAAYNTFVKGLG